MTKKQAKKTSERMAAEALTKGDNDKARLLIAMAIIYGEKK